MKTAIKEAPTEEVLHMKIAEQGCYVDLEEVIFKKITEITSLENPPININEKIDVISMLVEFIKNKHIKPPCKKLMEDTMSFNFNAALQDEAMMNLAREAIENVNPTDKVIKEWQEQLTSVNRVRKKEKLREMLEKKWDGFINHKPQKDPETSSVISYGSNATATMIQRLPATKYRADIAKKVLDNILVFDGKQGELSQFLSTIELYSTMYRVRKVDLVM